MAGKLSGSAIQSGTITVTQLSVGLNDTTNAAYAQANSAYGQANAARSDANTTFATVNTTFGTINTNYQAAYAQANTSLSASGGTLAGDLIITGNLTVSGNSTTLNTEILTVEDADIVLLSNVASTPALNAGIIVNRGTSTNTFLRWDEVTDKWGWSDDGSTTYKFNSALDAYAQANGAYGAANNRVLKAGDTMTGQLNISAGGLLVTGNVGIGASSPQSKLEVATSSGDFSHFGATSTANGQFTGITLGYRENNSSYRKAAIVQEQIGDNSARGHLHLLVDIANDTGSVVLGDSKLMIHGTTGNIGIGTSSPGYKLTVAGASGSAVLNLLESGVRSWGIRAGGAATNTFDIADFTAAATRLTIDSSGNLGINNTSPSSIGKFVIQVDGTTTPTNGSNVGPSSVNLYAAGNGGSTNCTIGIFGWQAGNAGIGSGIGFTRESSADWGTQIRFYTHPTTTTNIGDITERARIDSSGNLGIGTTSPTAKLHISQSGAATSLNIDGIENPIFATRYAANADSAVIFLAKSRNATVGSHTILQNGDEIATLKARGSDGTNFVDAAYITFAVDGTPGTNDMPGRIVFGTSPDGSASIQERARIDSSGNLLVGRTTTNGFTSASTYISKGLSVEWGEDRYIGMPYLTGSEYFNGMLLDASERETNIRAQAADGASKITFSTGSTPSERARFLTNGNFCIGKTTASESATAGSGFGFASPASDPYFTIVNVQAGGANGCIYLNRRNTQATNLLIAFYTNDGTTSSSIGSITHNNTATAYNTSSDRRLKDNIAPADNAGSVIDAIEVVKHDWKAGGHTRYGMIAQDLHMVAPEAVSVGDADDVEELKNPWGVDYSKLVPMLVKELQSVRARLAALEGNNYSS